MKRLLASVLCAAMAFAFQPISLVAAAKSFGQQAQAGQISGRAMVDGKPLGNVTVRLRNVDTGQIAGSTRANASGEFSFTGLPAGNYVVETVGDDGRILGTSVAVGLTAAAMVATNITVGTSAAILAAAGGAAAVGGGAFLGSTLGLVVLGAGALGVTAGIVAATGDASPSR